MRAGRRQIIGLTVAAAGLAAVPSFANQALARNRVEIPKYTVVETHETFEVRRYAPRIVAEVEVGGSPRQASNAGFRILANYIFGANVDQASIDMTAPVSRQAPSTTIDMTAPVDRRATPVNEDGTQRWVITFTMPSQYSMETLPRPTDRRIRIRELAPTTYAVMRFSGSPAEGTVRERMAALRQWATDAGHTPRGEPPTYARYDPPWVPSFMRRNEILLALNTPAVGG